MSTLLYNRILIIDDNPAIHEDFQKIFNHISEHNSFDEDEIALFGESSADEIMPFFELDSAYQGQEGLEKVKKALESKEPYAVAFVDSRMPPGWDGIQTIEEIWKSDPDIQVVICTAYSDYSWEEIVKRLGNTDRLLILKKPFDNVEVRQLASALTKKWHLGQEIREQLDDLQNIVAQKTEDLNKSQSLVRATLDATTDGILVIDLNKNIIDYNQRFINMWSLPNEIIENKNLSQIERHVKPALKDASFEISAIAQDGQQEGYNRIELHDGRIFERYFQPQYIENQIIGNVISFRDITRRNQMELELAYQATHDTLTGLPNKIILLDRIRQAISISKRQNTLFAIVYINLQSFNQVISNYGHKVSNHLLQAASARLKKSVRDCDTVVRLGGDDFVIVITNFNNEENIIPMVDNLLKVINEPFYVDAHELHITANIGISMYPTQGDDPELLLKNADTAMYRAKDFGGNNIQLYNDEMNIRLANRISMQADLAKALERNEFILHYQPIVDLNTGHIISNEALLRWQHPKLGLVPPQDFISLIEEADFSIPLSKWIIKEACTQNKRWQDSGLGPIAVAVNISSYQLRQNDIASIISEGLAESGLGAKYLELEFTEAVVIEHGDKAKMLMRELKSKGIRLTMDDFGTGYSSLNYLQHFPIDKIKIDKSFIAYISPNPEDNAITQAIINIGKALKIKVIAEGVENAEQLAYLQKTDCDAIQGFYFSRPQPANVIEGYLTQMKSLFDIAK